MSLPQSSPVGLLGHTSRVGGWRWRADLCPWLPPHVALTPSPLTMRSAVQVSEFVWGPLSNRAIFQGFCHEQVPEFVQRLCFVGRRSSRWKSRGRARRGHWSADPGGAVEGGAGVQEGDQRESQRPQEDSGSVQRHREGQGEGQGEAQRPPCPSSKAEVAQGGDRVGAGRLGLNPAGLLMDPTSGQPGAVRSRVEASS